MNENVNVCITPKGEKPVLHFSQFDNENVFTVTVLADDGESAAVLTGLDIEFRIRKTDSHVVTIAPESVADNVITFKTTEQLCACCGQNIATVTLMKDDMVVSTLDILVDIQRDILSGGLTSESDIRNLTTQIEQIVPEVVGDDYYNKQEVDDLLAEHTFDPTNYYDKSAVDDLLADKADSDDVYIKSDVYNKTETDNLLADKANISDVYAKTEVNNLLSAKMDTIGYHGIVDDAAVISFTTDCKAPLDIIKGKITPVQSGSGTPSPQNVRPISGFSALNVTRTGVNLWNEDWEVGDYDASTGAKKYPASKIRNKTPIFVNPNANYRVVPPSTANGLNIFFYDKNGDYINYYECGSSSNFIFTTPANCGYVNFSTFGSSTTTYNNDISINYPSSDTEYHAYNGQTATVNFGQEVYGGVVDVTNGKLIITHEYCVLNGTETITSNQQGGHTRFSCHKLVNLADENASNENFCSHFIPSTEPLGQNQIDNTIAAYRRGIYWRADQFTDETAMKNYLLAQYNANTPIMYVAKLATPIEIDTTPETVLSIAGDNNIFLDTGNLTEIAYFEGAEDNLIKLIKACQI